MVEVYVQRKTYIKCLVVMWLLLIFKVLFTWKCIKIFFYFLKIIFYISASKWSENTKKILIWSKKNIFFQKYFWNAKTNRIIRNLIIKICKNCFSNLIFLMNFIIKNIIWCIIKYLTIFCFTTNIKTASKQTKPQAQGWFRALRRP